MHKEFFTAAELAAYKLEGYPKTKRGINKKASAENWGFIREDNQNDGRKYSIKNLPKNVRIELMQKVGAELVHEIDVRADKRAKNRAEKIYAWDDKRKNKAMARASLVKAAEQFIADGGFIKRVGFDVFAQEYNANRIEVEAWIKDSVKKLSRASLERWQSQRKNEGFARLGKQAGRKSGGSVIDKDKEVADFIKGIIYEKPHLSTEVILLAIEGRFSEERIPAKRTLQRYIKNFRQDNAQILLRASNPDAWRSKYMVAVGDASAKAQYLNHIWEFDSTPTDIMLADGKRHTILGVIDVWSRRVKFLVSHSSNSAAVAALIRKAITDWGYPKIAKTDNGSDYVSQHIRDAFAALDIEHELCIPFSPQEKPHIERVFRTFSHNVLEALPGYVGHNVAEREALDNRKGFAQRLLKEQKEAQGATVTNDDLLTAEELQAYCDAWVDGYYHHKKHGSLDCSPVQKFLQSTTQPKTIDDESELFILLNSQSGVRTVQKSGVAWNKKHYSAACLTIYAGQTVKVRLDDSEPGAIYVFTTDNQYIGRAIDPDYYQINNKQHALTIKRAQSNYLNQSLSELKANAQKSNLDNIHIEILAHQAAKHEKIIPMPKKGEIHKPNAVKEAEKAKGIIITPETPEDKEKFAAYKAEKEAKKVVQMPKKDDPFEIFMRAIDLQKQIEKGLPIQPADAEFLNRYTASAKYRTAMATYKRGGKEAVRRVII